MTLVSIQARLKAAGLYALTVDGKWGPGIDAAIVAAMDKAGLPVPAAPIVKTPMVGAPDVQHPQYTIELFIRHFIETYEGGLSMDPKDSGNTYRGVLTGSKYGVTAAALASHRGTPNITPADIASLTEDEAIRIGLDLYYDRPDFDLMPWNPVTASIMDMGWGAGPGQAIKLMQRMIIAGDDGKIGPRTVQAYEEFILEWGLEVSAQKWCDVRYAFYDKIIAVKPSNAKYRQGWRNRSAGFLPGTPFWLAWNLPLSNR